MGAVPFRLLPEGSAEEHRAVAGEGLPLGVVPFRIIPVSEPARNVPGNADSLAMDARRSSTRDYHDENVRPASATVPSYSVLKRNTESSAPPSGTSKRADENHFGAHNADATHDTPHADRPLAHSPRDAQQNAPRDAHRNATRETPREASSGHVALYGSAGTAGSRFLLVQATGSGSRARVDRAVAHREEADENGAFLLGDARFLGDVVQRDNGISHRDPGYSTESRHDRATRPDGAGSRNFDSHGDPAASPGTTDTHSPDEVLPRDYSADNHDARIPGGAIGSRGTRGPLEARQSSDADDSRIAQVPTEAHGPSARRHQEGHQHETGASREHAGASREHAAPGITNRTATLNAGAGAADDGDAPFDLVAARREPFAVPSFNLPDDAATTEFVLDTRDDQPLGVIGGEQPRPITLDGGDFFPIEDRWRLGFPEWDRYVRSSLANPYRASVIKGDYPLFGTEDLFLELTAFSDSFFESRDVPVAAGKVNQRVFQETIFLTADLFRGDNSFHPSEWFLTVTPAFRLVDTSATGTAEDITIQEGFAEAQLAIVSDFYDTTNVRVGRQAFASDFLGFVFADTNDAVRLFGTNEALRTFWNIVFFAPVQKDAASALNTFESRQQQIVIANVIRQDFMFPGFNVELAAHYDNDTFKDNDVDAFWLEAAADGRIGRWDVSAAFVQALGHDELNPIAGRPVNVNAQLAALELAYPLDWITPKVSALYASGDKNPTDGVGRGFDAIFDNPNFAGDGFSYLNRENIVIGGTRLSNAFSFLPNMRAKAADPANFVNPGIILLNAGFDTVITTRMTALANVNYYQFVHTEPVALAAGLPDVGKEIGLEFNAGVVFKPFIVDNVIIAVGASVLEPGAGITDLSGDDRYLYTAFSAVTVVY
jgi:hypothetical protein